MVSGGSAEVAASWSRLLGLSEPKVDIYITSRVGCPDDQRSICPAIGINAAKKMGQVRAESSEGRLGRTDRFDIMVF